MHSIHTCMQITLIELKTSLIYNLQTAAVSSVFSTCTFQCVESRKKEPVNVKEQKNCTNSVTNCTGTMRRSGKTLMRICRKGFVVGYSCLHTLEDMWWCDAAVYCKICPVHIHYVVQMDLIQELRESEQQMKVCVCTVCSTGKYMKLLWIT